MSAEMLDSLWAAILTSDVPGGLYRGLSGSIFLDRAPADTPLPLCVYTVRTLRNASTTAGREVIMVAVFSFFSKADSTDDIVLAQSRLRTLLDGKSFACTSHDRMVSRLLVSGVPRQDDDAWQIDDEYELRGTRTST